MTMTATVYGRAAFEPRQHTTKSGNAMTSIRLAVDVTGRDESDAQTFWVDVLGFGRAADDLAAVAKGAMVSAMGKLTRGTYTGKDGTERESWSLLADSVLSARSGRPGARPQGSRTDRPSDAANRANAAAQAPSGAPFDDSLPF
jgi:single-strand DNA-binding protein